MGKTTLHVVETEDSTVKYSKFTKDGRLEVTGGEPDGDTDTSRLSLPRDSLTLEEEAIDNLLVRKHRYWDSLENRVGSSGGSERQ